MMRVVAALGGNALLRRGQPLDIEAERLNVRRAASALATVAHANELIVTHGNGPQVGLLALRAAAFPDAPPDPLDVLGAESEGMIGYLIEQELANVLPDRDVATLLTQVVVAADDPAFDTPTKPIGPLYERAQADALANRHGWRFAADGTGWRRVVASPKPLRIVEIAAIRTLLKAGVVVICAGGGGIPVIERDGKRYGVEAVVDKDLAAACLAAELHADILLLLTDQAAVWQDWPEPRVKRIARASPNALRAMRFDQGSMGPKVEAACRFATTRGTRAAIGALDDAIAVLRGASGTSIEPGDFDPVIVDHRSSGAA